MRRWMGKTADLDAAQRAELGAFLRARRESLRPENVGLRAPPTRRNTPGLRREEVAQVSGVGLTWYTWLEQGRPITTSSAVIDALARALRLDQEGRTHLRYLAGLPVPEPNQPTGDEGQFDALLDTLLPAPACILGPRFDFLAWNETFARIWHPETLPVGRCNVMWMAFCDPERRRTWVNWEERSRTLLAEFRAAAGRDAGDHRFTELVGLLEEESSDFRAWWATYEVRQSIAGPLRIRIPRFGIITLDVIELRICSHPSFRLSVHAPAQSSDKQKVARLVSSSVGSPTRLAETG
jgi:transcriptional regulator with XRE-family HTH domain